MRPSYWSSPVSLVIERRTDFPNVVVYAARRYNTHMCTSKICSKCKIEKPASAFTPRPNRPAGLYSQCKQCKGRASSQRYQKRRQQDPISLWVMNTRSRAADRARRMGIFFDLVLGDVRAALNQTGNHCAYCDTLFNFRGTIQNRARSPSLDRILPSLGYSANNIVVVCYRCNQIKSDATPEELTRIADRARILIEKRGLRVL